MSAIYLTGTRNPGKALKRFLPDYLDMLAQRGYTVLTTNKPGVDRLVLQHCDTHRLPLQVIEFACDSGDRNRRVKAKSGTVQIHKVVSPSWQRFQHVIDKADKVMFFHAAKTRGRCDGLSTIQAFDKACERRGIAGEQLIIQSQHAAWVSETELRNSPTLGATHIHVYSRFVPGLNGERHSIGYFRIDSWRKIGGVVQPGQGLREIVLPNVRSKYAASLQMLHQALLVLDGQRPEQLVIHFCTRHLDKVSTARQAKSPISELLQQVQTLLKGYPHVIWKREKPSDLRQQIGKPVKSGQALWYHKKRAEACRGLYQ